MIKFIIKAINIAKELDKYLFQKNISLNKYVEEKLIKTPVKPEIQNLKKTNIMFNIYLFDYLFILNTLNIEDKSCY